MSDRVEYLEGRPIVSCQALSGEPLHSFFVMGRIALVAKEDRATGIRANTKEDIAEIQKQMDLPVIGTIKRDYEDSKVYVIPTMKGIEELMGVKSEIIALDATLDLRSGAESLDEFCREIRVACPDQLLVTDCSTMEETLHADQLGFDFIGTTLMGYTEQSRGLKIKSDDFPIIHGIVAKIKHRVIAEGNINTPEKAGWVIELGVFSVVMGSIVTRPQLITRSFVQAIEVEG